MAYKNNFWQSEYFSPALILLLCHIFVNAFGWPSDRFDYVLILYVFYLSHIDEKTALGYALVFGIAYDISYPVFLGLGVLFFQVLNFMKIKAAMLFDANKAVFGLGFTVFIVIFYFAITLKFHNYEGVDFWMSLLRYLKYNVIALVLLWVIFGGSRGLSHSKR
jgi:cell shape-determining protein MreD